MQQLRMWYSQPRSCSSSSHRRLQWSWRSVRGDSSTSSWRHWQRLKLVLGKWWFSRMNPCQRYRPENRLCQASVTVCWPLNRHLVLRLNGRDTCCNSPYMIAACTETRIYDSVTATIQVQVQIGVTFKFCLLYNPVNDWVEKGPQHEVRTNINNTITFIYKLVTSPQVGNNETRR